MQDAAQTVTFIRLFGSCLALEYRVASGDVVSFHTSAASQTACREVPISAVDVSTVIVDAVTSWSPGSAMTLTNGGNRHSMNELWVGFILVQL